MSEYKIVFTDKIFDNAHGFIGLTKVESEIVELPIFKRLRHLKHLSLANWVFPGAEHTRYIHSLGVMHVIDQINIIFLDSIVFFSLFDIMFLHRITNFAPFVLYYIQKEFSMKRKIIKRFKKNQKGDVHMQATINEQMRDLKLRASKRRISFPNQKTTEDVELENNFFDDVKKKIYEQITEDKQWN